MDKSPYLFGKSNLFLDSTLLIPNVWVFHTKQFTNSLQTSYPAIEFNFDTNFLESVHTPQGKGLISQASPKFRSSHK
jgi:hypothetical protein